METDEKVEMNLDEIACRMGQFMRSWGRIDVFQTKEKYGTVRVYCGFHLSLHSLVYPGYSRSKFPDWLWRADLYALTPVLNFLFGKLVFLWQKTVYRQAYRRELQRYPEYRREILCCADYPELLVGL